MKYSLILLKPAPASRVPTPRQSNSGEEMTQHYMLNEIEDEKAGFVVLMDLAEKAIED